MTSRMDGVKELTVLAFEDGSFSKLDEFCLIVGVLTISNAIEQVHTAHIHVDGKDATAKIVSLAQRYRTSDVVLLPSISFGGFNVIDPHELHERLKVPVLVVNPRKPSMRSVYTALRDHFIDWEDRVCVFRRIGRPNLLTLDHGDNLYFYCVGISKGEATSILRSLICFGKKPEPLRIARMIARALSDPAFTESIRRTRHQPRNKSLFGKSI